MVVEKPGEPGIPAVAEVQDRHLVRIEVPGTKGVPRMVILGPIADRQTAAQVRPGKGPEDGGAGRAVEAGTVMEDVEPHGGPPYQR